MMRSAASAVPMPVFFRLWVSLADTPMQKYSTPQAKPALEPLLVQHERRESRARRLCAGRRSA